MMLGSLLNTAGRPARKNDHHRYCHPQDGGLSVKFLRTRRAKCHTMGRRLGRTIFLRAHALLQLSVFSMMVASAASAFRPPPLSEELGCSPTLSFLADRERYLSAVDSRKQLFVFFDPLQLATDFNFARMREAELKHGRVAMLAATQTICIPILKRATLTDQLVEKDFPEGLVQFLHATTQGDLLADFLKVVLACGFLETLVLVQKDDRDMPGDYGTGYFGVRDKGLHETELIIELEHGRLAMIGIVGFVALDYLTGGESWLEQWLDVFEKLVEVQ